MGEADKKGMYVALLPSAGPLKAAHPENGVLTRFSSCDPSPATVSSIATPSLSAGRIAPSISYERSWRCRARRLRC